MIWVNKENEIGMGRLYKLQYIILHTHIPLEMVT